MSSEKDRRDSRPFDSLVAVTKQIATQIDELTATCKMLNALIEEL